MRLLEPEAWFVVQVAPRSEQRVASILEYKGYEPFAPTYTSRKQWSDRVKKLEKALFPGYVFVRVPGLKIAGLVCSTPGVVRILGSAGQPDTVPDFEIDTIRKLVSAGRPRPTPYVNVGQKVELQDGPFAGVVGIIRQIRNRACLIASVQLISHSICIVVDELQIGPVQRWQSASDVRFRAENRGITLPER